MAKNPRFRLEYYEGGEVAECYLDDIALESEGDDEFFVESSQLEGIRLSEIPAEVTLVPILGIENHLIHIDVPARISRFEDGRARIGMEFMERRKFWDQEVGLGKYVAAFQSALKMRAASIGDVEDIDVQDDGDYVFIHWNLIITEDLEFQDALLRVREVDDELRGHTDQIVYGLKLDPKEVNDEGSYTTKVVMPLLISMGFQDVHYNHGAKEFGKDVTFSRLDEFGVLRHYGAQVKFGDVSGEAGSILDELIGQVDDAFAMPYQSLYGKETRYISGLYLIASGKFTRNAQEKILNKVAQSSIRTNMTFLDGEKVMELVERFRRSS